MRASRTKKVHFAKNSPPPLARRLLNLWHCMKVLLIGGAGFIGSRTALSLLSRGHEPVIIDSLDPQIHGTDLAASETLRRVWPEVRVICGDTRDRDVLERTLPEVEAVYYFAAGTGTGQSMYQIERYSDVNVRGAAIFAEALQKAGGHLQRVVVSSSRAVYGEGAAISTRHGRVFPNARLLSDLESGDFQSKCPVDGGDVEAAPSKESDPVRPVSIYGITKLAQEQLIHNVCTALNLPATIFRYQNVYGPGQSLKNAYTGILSIFTQLILAGRSVNLFEDGLPTRDFVYIDDVVEYNVRALEVAAPQSTILNIGSGERSTLVDLVKAVGTALGQTPEYHISGQFRVGDIRNAVADTAKLQAELGAHTFVSLPAGVKQFVDWVQKEGSSPDANTRFDRSLDEMRQAGLLREQKS